MKFYKKKKKSELEYWVDMPISFMDSLSDQERMELTNQHYNFTQSNGVAILSMFLTSQCPENEEYVKELCDECFS